jgi:hypothetical protein
MTLQESPRVTRGKQLVEKPKDLPSLALLLFYHSTSEARYTETDDPYLHAADLYDLCTRQVHLLQVHGKKMMRYIPPATRMNWELGKALEQVIKTWLMERDVLAVENPALIHEDLGIIGHPDARLKTGQILEIKSKDPALFRLMKTQPLIRDRVQVWIYLMLAQTSTARLLAATWGSTHRNPYREYIVNFNARIPELVKRTVSPLREAQAGSTTIPKRICESVDSRRARTCPVRAECFAAPGTGLTQTIGSILERTAVGN